MSEQSMKITKLVICCCADYELIKKEHIQQLYTAAVNAGITVELCSDFCLETVENPAKLNEMSKVGTALAACQPRAVASLFSRAGVPAPQLIDIRHHPIENILKQYGWESAPETESVALPTYQNEWKAWFPVIDPQRCSSCGKCVDYCFFGVYQKNEKYIEVKFPQNCKNNCPACARVCPQHAIIFPKHSEAQINGGKTDSFNDYESVNTKKMFDENLYDRLAQRRRKNKQNKLLKE